MISISTLGRRLALTLLAGALATGAAFAQQPGNYAGYAPPYRFPYPQPSLTSSPHLKSPNYYSHSRQKYPGRWVWLLPSFHEIQPTHRGYYDNYIQLQFLRDY